MEVIRENAISHRVQKPIYNLEVFMNTNNTMTLYKLIILTLLDSVSYPLTNAILSDFLLEKEYTTYFTIQQALSELAEDGLVAREQTYNSSFYSLTENGRETFDLFGYTLNPKIRHEITAYLKEKNHEIIEKTSVFTNYTPARENEYTVTCRLQEKNAVLMDLSLTVPSEEAASKVCAQFQNKNSEIYAYLLKQLF